MCAAKLKSVEYGVLQNRTTHRSAGGDEAAGQVSHLAGQKKPARVARPGTNAWPQLSESTGETSLRPMLHAHPRSLSYGRFIGADAQGGLLLAQPLTLGVVTQA
jgi:hypothetical protein